MKTLRVWWPRTPRPGNLGDVLTPVILGYLGYRVRWATQGSADVLGIGSIVRFARAGQIVFGSGAMRQADHPNPRAEYLAVRGPLTRQIVERHGGTCPEVYGDPALLLSECVTGTVPKKHDLGLVPHYVDREHVRKLHPDEHVIDILRADPLEVVREIRECRAIVSSSLHGIIVAHAFGIPAAWVRWSDKLSGDGTKFQDYAESVGVSFPAYDRLTDVRMVVPVPEAVPRVCGALVAASRSL